MLMRRACRSLCVASAALSVIVFGSSAHAQDAVSAPSSLEKEVAAVRAENIALREQLLKLEEQQKTLLEQLNDLQRLIVGAAPAPVTYTPAPEKPNVLDANTTVSAANTGSASPPQAAGNQKDTRNHY